MTRHVRPRCFAVGVGLVLLVGLALLLWQVEPGSGPDLRDAVRGLLSRLHPRHDAEDYFAAWDLHMQLLREQEKLLGPGLVPDLARWVAVGGHPEDARLYRVRPTPQEFADMLNRHADGYYALPVLKCLKDPELKLLHWKLRGVLARCGGSDAAAYLREYYAGLPGGISGATRHIAPRPPYKLNQPKSYVVGGEQEDPNLVWVVVAGPGRSRYALYNADGLSCERELYLAVDRNGDDLFECVLPTGLTDVYFAYWFPGGIHEMSKQGDVTLKLTEQGVAITHHVATTKPNPYGGEEFAGAVLSYSSLSMDELTRDSDGDGLTDITERLLLTDPAKADTDCDGLDDVDDPTPNVNPATMGPKERGIARALQFFFCDPDNDRFHGGPWWRPDESGHPLRARYLLVDGVGPVAFSADASTQGVCAWTPEQRDQYNSSLGGYPSFSAAEITWNDRTAHLEELAKEGRLRARARKHSSSMEDILDGMYGSARYVVEIQFPGVWYAVLFNDIEGEYYPLEWMITIVT